MFGKQYLWYSDEDPEVLRGSNPICYQGNLWDFRNSDIKTWGYSPIIIIIIIIMLTSIMCLLLQNKNISAVQKYK